MREIAGRYRLVEKLGQGGMGVVWKARDERLHRHVAVKRLIIPAGAPALDVAAMRSRFLREARATAGLEHPAIIGVHDVVEEPGGDIWMIMEFIRGRSLQDAAAGQGLPVAQVARIGVALLGALATAHRAGIMHRDVKPANVLIAENGRTVLTDFGIAAVADATSTLTASGVVIGSAGYVAPERYDRGINRPESDLWSLGATLYYAAEGKRAYPADSMQHLIGRLFSGHIPEFERSGPLAPVIEGLLQRDISDRCDAATAEKNLKAIADGHTTLPKVPARDQNPTTVPDTGTGTVPNTASAAGKNAGVMKVASTRAGKVVGPVAGIGLWLLVLNPGGVRDRAFEIFDHSAFATTPPNVCVDVNEKARDLAGTSSAFTREDLKQNMFSKKVGWKDGYSCVWSNGDSGPSFLSPVVITVDRYDSSRAAQKSMGALPKIADGQKDIRVDNIRVTVRCQGGGGRISDPRGCAEELAAAAKSGIQAQRP
ncbi:serine/threonine protein kinase [Actinomadura logoneensis]|uniref:non-specific serine/threonine protein kinase n=1 Tax=Actinomadura logoneensis TaxID=2293572 RepID=A0A372JKU5_9ACTN|nr:serine/threonine-protein kinase [Actinomadura logoneensis]RFU39948.1 serine/threonine protein kinase [Actinomadura logoneensis]